MLSGSHASHATGLDLAPGARISLLSQLAGLDSKLRRVPVEHESDLGIPEHSRACLFDLDGVLTQTAVVHAAAWKEMFDGFLRQWGERTGQQLAPFDPVADYDNYVDGKPRADGTRSFLESRGINLPEGSAATRRGRRP